MSRFVIDANLDCESRWSGLALSRAVLERISAYGALVSLLAPDDVELEVWTPAAFDHLRWRGAPATFRVGTPPRADLVWANPAAKAANDRRLAHSVGALPGSKTITRVDELDLAGPWIAKVPWAAAGRDRCRGEGAPTVEQTTRLERLLAATGALVVEPWCDRVLDVGACATVDAGTVTMQSPHGLVVDARGGFVGIDLAPPALERSESARLAEQVLAAGAAIARTGYAGPFAIDAFAYRDGSGARRFHAPCEINARYSFGFIAHALLGRFGKARLGLAGEPPLGARTLVANTGDGVTAWIV